MKPECWQQLDTLFNAALAQPAEERAEFVEHVCAGDDVLRKQLESLLSAHEQAGGFMEKPAIVVEARAVANQETELNGLPISHYQIISLIGSGGMGQVFLAHDTVLARNVALKLLPTEFTNNPERVRRFQQEARAASSLNHPNIITIHEIGESEGRHFIAFEHIEGLTLREYLRESSGGGEERKAPSLYERVNIATQVAGALATAHGKGIVHRDVKPENIMLVKDRHRIQEQAIVKVLDFGIAKLTEPQLTPSETKAFPELIQQTHEGSLIGTAGYMSPEQARGDQVDARTDIWSLGVLLYEMITNKLPFDGDNPQDVVASILQDETPALPTEVPNQLRQIVKKALHKDRQNRYQTISEMFSDLREAERELAIPVNRKRQRVAAALVLALLIAVVAPIGYLGYFSSSVEAIDSIAVLPFSNTENDPNVEYFCDDFNESLTNSLSQLAQLKVIAQNSARKFKGQDIDSQKAANALGVKAIVTGKIVQRGDGLQINVSLIRAHDNAQIWGHQYGCKTTDIQSVQEEIARAITKELRVKLTGAQEQQLAKHVTNNSDAMQRYVEAELEMRKFRPDSITKAHDYYNEAIVLDPDFAAAYAGLAQLYNITSGSGVFGDPTGDHDRARGAAEKALQLDETNAEAHTWLGANKMDEWDWSGAEREFKRGIELNPNIPTTHAIYTFYLTDFGRHAEALEEIKRAEEADPLQVRPKYRKGMILYNARRYDEAIQQMQNTLALQPDLLGAYFFIGASYAMKGEYAQAIDAYQKSLDKDEISGILPYLAYAYAQSGKRNQALAILKTLKTTKTYVSPAEVAILYIGLGDNDEAFQLLERAYNEHDLQMQYLKVEPHYDSLRSDPRFANLMRLVGLPA